MNRNYQKELEIIIEGNLRSNKRPKLLLHSCCAPCSSYVLEYLSAYFDITIFFYNPNISPKEEYCRRVDEQQRLIAAMNLSSPINFIQGEYNPREFYDRVKGYEAEPEGGDRCFICYEMRLHEAARVAKEGEYDYFTTTLSISPYKKATKLNEIGEQVGDQYGAKYLPSDFKKKNGYKRSIELSKEYDLYRQDYCGCIYSKIEKESKDN
ncbi:MAG: epoxyqueuosine reductase QueH [Clostridiales bacterium]|nr:epoxyqueuosine reductase QueH [Clostridiales bacterium]